MTIVYQKVGWQMQTTENIWTAAGVSLGEALTVRRLTCRTCCLPERMLELRMAGQPFVWL